MTLTDQQREEIRAAANTVRQDSVRMTNAATCGHPGGPMGMADFMSTLFLAHLNLDADNRHDPKRDRFILGNGHTCAGLYSLLAQKGLFSRESLLEFRKFGSPLQGHPHRNLDLGIDMSTGSLGNGHRGIGGAGVHHHHLVGEALHGAQALPETRLFIAHDHREAEHGRPAWGWREVKCGWPVRLVGGGQSVNAPLLPVGVALGNSSVSTWRWASCIWPAE